MCVYSDTFKHKSTKFKTNYSTMKVFNLIDIKFCSSFRHLEKCAEVFEKLRVSISVGAILPA